MKARSIVIGTALAVVLGMAGAPPATAVDTYGLTVHAQTGSGAPIPGEYVQLLESYPGADEDVDGDGLPDGLIEAQYTAADGSTTFAGLADGAYGIIASSFNGLSPDLRADAIVAGGPVSVTVTDEHVMSVSGIVKNAATGAPVDSYVHATQTDGTQYIPVQTAADGTFTALATAGTFTAYAWAYGYRDDRTTTTFVVEDGVDLSGVVLRLYDMSRVSGKVSLAGKGVMNASVSLGYLTSGNGSYEGPIEPGTYVPYVVGGDTQPYFTTYYGGTVRKPDAAKLVVKKGYSATANIALVSAAQVSGTVVDRSGRPLSHVEIHASNLDRAGAATAATDLYGRYTLRGLASGRVQIWAADDSGELPAFGSRVVTAVQGSPVTGVKVAVADDAVVYGQIKTPGSNVTYQDISLVDSNGEWYGTYRPYSDGFVGFAGLPAGTYYVHVDGSNIRKQVVVKAHQQVSFGTITRGAQTTVKGVVRTAAGKPAVSALVVVSDKYGTAYATTRTSSTGTYSIKGAVSGSYTISVTPKYGTDAWTSAAVTVTAGQWLVKDLKLGVGATVTGVVLNAKGAPAVSVKVETSDGRSAKTNAAGAYTLTGLRSGYNRIWISDPSYVGGYRDASTSVTAKTSMTVKVPTVHVGVTATTAGATSLTAGVASVAPERGTARATELAHP